MRRPFHREPARNPFRLLPPSQAILARARRAGVDSSNGQAVAAWRALGEPKEMPK